MKILMKVLIKKKRFFSTGYIGSQNLCQLKRNLNIRRRSRIKNKLAWIIKKFKWFKDYAIDRFRNQSSILIDDKNFYHPSLDVVKLSLVDFNPFRILNAKLDNVGLGLGKK